MAGHKRNVSTSSPRATRSRTSAKAAAHDAVPSVYREMFREAKIASSSEFTERPRKRQKRPGEKPSPKTTPQLEPGDDDDDDDGESEIELEDVVIPSATVQTIFKEDSDEEEDDGIQFEDVNLDVGGPSAVSVGQAPRELSLNLTAQKNAMGSRPVVERRKAIGKMEKERRIEVHKMHLLCLLAHVERRNWWCNDPGVHDVLRPLLTDKMIRLLNPRPTLIQFGRTESLKNGLQETSVMFSTKFKITERGLRRALWPEDEEQLKDVIIHSLLIHGWL